MSHLRVLFGAALAALPLGGCYVYSEPSGYDTVAYEPPYYAGSAVYYDQAGAPYDYANGTLTYLPAGYAQAGMRGATYGEPTTAYQTGERGQARPRTVERREQPRERREQTPLRREPPRRPK